MAVVADGMGVIGSTAGGVAEEEAVRDLFFLWSASRLLV
jgi:serine/threonine protein phosphatase PrpC